MSYVEVLLLIEGRQQQDKLVQQRMGWLHWVVWQAQSSERLPLEDFLPGEPKTISAKTDPEAFAAELAKAVKKAEQRQKRKRSGKEPDASK